MSLPKPSRKGIDYDTIHEITMVDHWFIDKIAILVEMEQALQTQPLTVQLLREAKRIEFPDNVIQPPHRPAGS